MKNYLTILFVVLFLVELVKTNFKRKMDKRIWFFIAVFTGPIGYFFWICFKSKLIEKRVFSINLQNK